jgi:hypothetical protein
MRTFLLVSMVLSVPAWATGEKVVVATANPLHPLLCYSMSCVEGGPREATVSLRPTKDGVEFVVTNAAGQVTLVHKAGLNDLGNVSSTDLASASAAVIHAIESKKGPVASTAKTPAAKPAKLATRKMPKGKLVAHR